MSRSTIFWMDSFKSDMLFSQKIHEPTQNSDNFRTVIASKVKTNAAV